MIGFGSKVLLEAKAVLLTGVPATMLDGMWNVIENDDVSPTCSTGMVPVNKPPCPIGGWVIANAGPPVWVTLAKTVLAGTTSVTTTFSASLGPASETTIEYVTSPPAVTNELVSVLVTVTSAAARAVEVRVTELSEVIRSSGLVALPMSVMMMPSTTEGLTLTITLNVAVVPGASEATEKLTVPAPPTAGTEGVKVGPEVSAAETNVVFAGTRSVRLTLVAV